MPERPLSIEEILTRLRDAPPQIAALADASPAEELSRAPAAGEWSAVEVLAHLRACADVWGGCIATILAEDHPTIRAIDPCTWIRRTDYNALEFQPSLDAFTRQRDELLAVLDGLPADGWLRSATLAGSGRPIERTVQSFAGRLARHERPHIRQIARTIAATRDHLLRAGTDA